jgi:hypothetical protein
VLTNWKEKRNRSSTWKNLLQWLILPPHNTASGRAKSGRHVIPASNAKLRKELLSLLRQLRDKILFWSFGRNICRCSASRSDKILFWSIARNFCRCSASRCYKILFCVRQYFTSHFVEQASTIQHLCCCCCFFRLIIVWIFLRWVFLSGWFGFW